MRRQVLFVINSLAGGGAERVMVTLLRHSREWRERYAISLALLDDEPRAYEPPDWVPVHQLDGRGRLGRSLRQLRTLVGRTSPDLVVSFLTRANVASRLALAGHRTPLVMSERVNTDAHLGRGPGGQASRLLVRLTYPRAHRVLAVSQGVADDLVRLFAVPRERLSVIANPVDDDRIRESARDVSEPLPDGPYVAAMGRLMPNKNFGLLIDAFARSGTPGRLLILGEGSEREALERQAADLGLGDRILLPGFAANPFPLIAGARAYVLPSNAEGFPNGLVEAMALSVPVLATDCPSGPSEILAERGVGEVRKLECARHGLLVPCDDPAAMAEGLRRLQDEALRRSYAEAARRRADHFSIAASVRRYWAAIEAALAAAAPEREARKHLHERGGSRSEAEPCAGLPR